ncbi:MAG: hypothetical protein AAGF98_01790 [Cyanobacteria bacterium P01_H01_bin.153]
MQRFWKYAWTSLVIMVTIVNPAIAHATTDLLSHDDLIVSETREQLALLMWAQQQYRREIGEFASAFDQLRPLVAFAERTFAYTLAMARVEADKVLIMASPLNDDYPRLLGSVSIAADGAAAACLCELPRFAFQADDWLTLPGTDANQASTAWVCEVVSLDVLADRVAD